MKGVILAGGLGTRLRPLTLNLPKPMVPMVNRPIMLTNLELLKKHDITDIVISIYYQPEIIQDFFRAGTHLGVKIKYVKPDSDYGTAGSVKAAAEFLTEPFLVISADVLTDFDLKEVINFHREKEALATMVLTRVENPLSFGVVITNQEGKILRFLEKPTWGEVFSDTINTGIYVFQPEVLDYIPDEREFDFSKHLFPLLLEKKEHIYGYVVRGYWKDIGSLAEYRQAHYDVLQGEVDIYIPGKKIGRVGRNIWVGKDTEIDPTASLRGAVILGDNCRIGPRAYISNTVIGNNCVIEEAVNIMDNVIWDGVYIGPEAELKENVVGRGCRIKARAFLGVGAILSDECIIGEGSTVKANVKIWPHKVVEDGATLSSSLVWEEKWERSLFSSQGISGLANLEVTPEFAAKLGAAYGAYLGKGAFVVTSRDSHKTSRMINRALMAGILSTGANVIDLGVTPIPVARYELSTLGKSGGVHTRRSPFQKELMEIKFYDPNGMELASSKEKGIEALMLREDFRRVPMDETGELSFPSRHVEYYREGFMSVIDKEVIRKRGFKIVIDYSFSPASLIFPSILGELGCEVVALNAYMDATQVIRTMAEFSHSLAQLANIVISLKADAGFLLDPGAEKLFLVDENGNIITGDLELASLSLAIMRVYPGGTIAVPISASRAIDRMAREYQCRVIRTKTDYRSMEEVAHKKGVIFVGEAKGGFIFSQFHCVFDSMMATVKTLELLAKMPMKISEVTQAVPPINIVRSHVPCPWELKGAVMRKLLEETQQDPVELLDGIKVFHNESWVLIIPDGDRPLFHVNAEAETKEEAQVLINRYSELIRKIQNGAQRLRLERI